MNLTPYSIIRLWPGANRALLASWGRYAVCVLACLALFGGARAASAAQSTQELLAALDAEGFENLSVEKLADSDTIRIAYENRRFRWEVVGLGNVLGIASAQQNGRLMVVPLHTGVPMLQMELQAADYRAFLRGEMSAADLFGRMTFTQQVQAGGEGGRNASYGKVDLTFSPGLRMNLVTPAPPGVFTGAEIRLQPGVYANLWRGLTFDGTYTVPLSSSEPALTRAAASFNSRLGTSGYLQAQGGRLAQGLDGFAAQATFVSENGKHQGGLTATHAAYPGMKRILGYQAFYSWRPGMLDVVGTVSAGRYMQGDSGYSLGLWSGFGESAVEFYLTKTDLSRTMGAGFTIPLGWQRQAYPNAVRARFRNAFRFMYTDEKPTMNGGLTLMFADGYQMAIRRLNQTYLRTYAEDLREAGKRWLPADAPPPAQ